MSFHSENQKGLEVAMKKALFARIVFIVLILAGPTGCYIDLDDFPLHAGLVDPDATPETQAVYENLKRLSGKHILFGHQDTTAYGVGWWNDPAGEDTSDVKNVCGSFPAVYGWDVEGVGTGVNIDGVDMGRMRELIEHAYARGGINTFSWHLHNIPNGGSAWDTEADISRILPGGEKHGEYTQELDYLAHYLLNLRGLKGELIPVIFRPFHENNGDWFWWGRKSCTPEEYKHLWRFTVEYLRDVRQVHNLLYAYSPDLFYTYRGYLCRYPGNDYVDILGHDDYAGVTVPGSPLLIYHLARLSEIAAAFGKVAALTETGFEGIPCRKWWTMSLLNPIKMSKKASRIAYLLVWRNANAQHFFAPYPGHPSAEDFIAFYNDPMTMFEDDLPDMYTWP